MKAECKVFRLLQLLLPELFGQQVAMSGKGELHLVPIIKWFRSRQYRLYIGIFKASDMLERIGNLFSLVAQLSLITDMHPFTPPA